MRLERGKEREGERESAGLREKLISGKTCEGMRHGTRERER